MMADKTITRMYVQTFSTDIADPDDGYTAHIAWLPGRYVGKDLLLSPDRGTNTPGAEQWAQAGFIQWLQARRDLQEGLFSLRELSSAEVLVQEITKAIAGPAEPRVPGPGWIAPRASRLRAPGRFAEYIVYAEIAPSESSPLE